MKPRRRRLNLEQQRWVRDWWRALQPREKDDKPLPPQLWPMGRGERAQLRRCANAEALLFHPATLLLAERLIELDGERGALPDRADSYENVAWVAGVLAEVKADQPDGKTLAWHLGREVGQARKPMSTLRFQNLQRAMLPADLFVQWRRAVQLADGKADVALLADDLLSWLIELGRSPARASDGVKFHWACDYYLSDRDRAAAAEKDAFNQEIPA